MMTTDDPLLGFFAHRQSIFVKRLNRSVSRVVKARFQSRQDWHDDWEACQPRTIGHAMGRRKATLEDIDGE